MKSVWLKIENWTGLNPLVWTGHKVGQGQWLLPSVHVPGFAPVALLLRTPERTQTLTELQAQRTCHSCSWHPPWTVPLLHTEGLPQAARWLFKCSCLCYTQCTQWAEFNLSLKRPKETTWHCLVSLASLRSYFLYSWREVSSIFFAYLMSSCNPSVTLKNLLNKSP